MQFWNEIVNTAILGTEKKPLAAALLPAELQEAAALVSAQTGTDPEDQFLQVAAVAFNFRQSGTVALHKEGLTMAGAEKEILSYSSETAMQALKDILAEDYSGLLDYWLQRCSGAHRLVQPEWVPVLLNRAVNHPSLRGLVSAVCGKRGEWLVRFNPSWQWVVATGDEEVWQTGKAEQRRAVLRKLRQTDPVGARELLLQSWAQENANSKAELLKQLDGTVTSYDESWLMDLLNEKSQKVKDEALRLLKQLPGSLLIGKYREFLLPLFTLKKEKALLGMIQKTTLQVQVPAVIEAFIYGTGIEKLSNQKLYTDEEFVLFQVMQYIPPSYWEAHFGQGPSAIIGYFQKDQEKYIPALIQATVQFGDQAWASALADQRDVFYSELLSLLPPEQKDPYCLRFIGQQPDMVIQGARQLEGVWGIELTREIFKHTARTIYQYNISFYKENIHRIPFGILPELSRFAAPEPHFQIMWTNLSDQLSKLLNLKNDIYKAFNE